MKSHQKPYVLLLMLVTFLLPACQGLVSEPTEDSILSNGDLAVTTDTLPDGALATPYAATLQAQGGTPPYTWALDSGTLPDGLSLATTGDISGTPEQEGNFTFTAEVSDSSSPKKKHKRGLAIRIHSAVLIETTTLPDGTVNKPYSATLTASGGATPYKWNLINGTLPPGLDLSTPKGEISGTPSASGLFSFTVQVTDNIDQTDSKNFSIQVLDGSELTLQPNSISFGDVEVGSIKTKPFALTNSGSVTVEVTQADITGTSFTLDGPSLPLALAAGETASFSATFSPDTEGGSAGSISFVSDADNSPTTLSLSGNGVVTTSHFVDLTWDASPSTNVVGYNVYRGTESGGPYTKLNDFLVGLAYTDDTVQNGITYFYVVTAVADNGAESDYSNEAQASIPSS